MAAGSAIRAGRAFVELFLDDSELSRGLKKAQKRMQGFGQTLSKIGVGAVGLGASVAGAFVPSIKAAADFENTLTKFDTVFADNAKTVREWGKNFGKEIGRSENQILSFLANTQDLLVPLGFERGDAENMSKQITKLSVDLAAFNGFADADSLRDLNSALTGSGEVMKKYGVQLNAAAVQQELLNQGFDPSAATEQQKVMARLNIILACTTDAQGAAARMSNTFTERMKRLKAQMSDVAVTIGQTLLPIITPLVEQAGEFVQQTLVPWIDRNKELIPTILKLGTGLAATGAGLIAFGKIVTGASATIGAFNAVMKAAQAGSIAFKGGLVGLALGGILAVSTALFKANPHIREFNRQLQIGERLASALNDATSKRQNEFLKDVAVLSTPEEKRAALTDELSRADKNVAGLESREASLQQEVEQRATLFGRASGNKMLAAARANLEELQPRLAGTTQ